MSVSQKIDAWLGKWASRKLVVWLSSTALLVADKVNGDQWVAISLAYIGLQGAADIASKWKHGK
jgi:hypothetical protein|tara:strand:- start:1347 stop:1538 length:192 start_codon:yes stop_codon:yes gene_type:complete